MDKEVYLQSMNQFLRIVSGREPNGTLWPIQHYFENRVNNYLPHDPSRGLFFSSFSNMPTKEQMEKQFSVVIDGVNVRAVVDYSNFVYISKKISPELEECIVFGYVDLDFRIFIPFPSPYVARNKLTTNISPNLLPSSISFTQN